MCVWFVQDRRTKATIEGTEICPQVGTLQTRSAQTFTSTETYMVGAKTMHPSVNFVKRIHLITFKTI